MQVFQGLPSLRAILGQLSWRAVKPDWRSAAPVSATARNVMLDPSRVDAFVAVCGGPEAPRLPLTFPHAMLTPLHMWLLLDKGFPFPALGIVHRAERIVRTRTIAVGTPVDVTATIDGFHEVPSGVAFSLRSTLSQDGEVIWSHTTDAVRRVGAGTSRPYTGDAPHQGELEREWAVPSGTGRRYGLVSGNIDPIHMSNVSAWAFGYPHAVVHGMWTVSRTVAELGEPFGAATLDVRFRSLLMAPSHVRVVRVGERFAVWRRNGDRPILEGVMSPVAELGPSRVS